MQAYPLAWPQGWKRTPSHERERSKFGTQHQSTYGGYKSIGKLSVSQATERLINEIDMFTRRGNPWRIPPDGVVLSTNVPLRKDGFPRSNQSDPDDPGAAVYFQLDGARVVLACDKWNRVADNIAAIAATLGAMRALERWGVSDMLHRVFTGFTALPNLNMDPPWRDVLGVKDCEDLAVAESAYKRLRSLQHPDKGGDANRFAMIQRAISSARAELSL